MSDLTLDDDVLGRWIGRSATISDRLDATQVAQLAAVLGRSRAPGVGEPLPPLWHWAFFGRRESPSELGEDGHPRKGGLIPPVALPRRMWAGGRIEFHAPLVVGDHAERRSTVASVDPKRGRSGALCFVTIEHVVSSGGEICVREEQDLVYAERRPTSERHTDPSDPPGDAVWSATVVPDPVMLFRYSALTANTHRIHYDLAYCREVEGHPALVVHGPLLATLLAGLSPRDREWQRFAFRATAPVFATGPFGLDGRPSPHGTALWITRSDGKLAMTAEATW